MSNRFMISWLLLIVLSASCSRDPNVIKAQYVQKGNKYFDAGKYREASIMYRTALQKDQKYGEAYYRLALTDLKTGQPAHAVSMLRRAVELLQPNQPERTDARVKLADIFLDYLERSSRREGELVDEVTKTAADLVKADPKSVEGHRLQGRLDFVLAVAAFNKRDTEAKTDALQKAIAEFKIADSLKPNQTDVVVYLSRALIANQQYDEAEKLYLGLLDRQKDYERAYLELDRMYRFRNQPEKAEAILKRAIANNPKKYALLINLAQFYHDSKRRDDEIKVLETLKSHAKEYPEAFEQVGAFYFRLGDGAEAMRQYQEGMKANPERKIFYQKMTIEILMQQGKREEAKKINEAILAADPKDTDALGLQASLLMDKGDVQNAINQLQLVLARAPSNFVAHYNLGKGLAQKGDLEPARAQLDEAIRLRPDYTEARMMRGQIEMTKHEFERALKSADDILAYDRNNMPARLLRSSSLLGLNRLDQAQAELKHILETNPNSQDAMLQMGVLHVAQKNYKEAETTFRQSYDLNPANSKGLLALAEVMMTENQPDRALEMLQKEIQKFPTRNEFRVALANIEVRAGKYDKAITEFNALLDKVDRKSPTAANLYLGLGETQAVAKNVPAAIDSLQKARDILPNNAVILIALASVLDAGGQKKEAKLAYESALRTESENAVALNNLAYNIAETAGGDLDQALTFAQRANQKLPQVAEISDTLGWIYLKKNLTDNALEIFRNNVTKVPGNSTYRYHLAMALYQKGDKVHAKEELQKALSSNPGKEEEKSIRDLIGRI